MALTSSAALGTSEDDWRDVSKEEDWEEEEDQNQEIGSEGENAGGGTKDVNRVNERKAVS